MPKENIYLELKEIARKKFAMIQITDENIYLTQKEKDNEVLLLPENFNSISNYFKIGWLLGKEIRIITPHTFIKYDIEWEDPIPSEDPVTTWYYADKSFQLWQEKITENFGNKVKVVPGNVIEMYNRVHFDDTSTTGGGVSFKGFNIDKPLVLTDKLLQSKDSSTNKILVDIPSIVISDLSLIEKIQNDYPIATTEFKLLIKKSYELIESKKSDTNPKLLVEELNDVVIRPGIAKIKAEYKEIKKSTVIKSAAEITSISLPILVSILSSGLHQQMIASLLSAGIGLRIANNLVDMRSKKVKIKKEGFYAGMKMKI